MKYLAALAALVLISACGPIGPFGVQEQADFFNCGPGPGGDDHIVACAPGTTLTGCEPIGSGKTDLDIVDCQ